MLEKSFSHDRSDDEGHLQSAHDEEEQLHMRRATSLLRLLKSSGDLSHESGDLKREFLQLTALLRRIDKLASDQSIEQEVAEVNAGDSRFPPPDIELNGTDTAFGSDQADQDEPVEPAADVLWDDEPHPSYGEPQDYGDTDDSDDSSAEFSPSPEETPFDPAEFDPQPSASATEPPETEDVFASKRRERMSESSMSDSNLRRWWVTFSGNLSLEKLANLRERLSDSPFTLETRFDEIADGMIVLRVVTDNRVSPHQIEWLVRELMDTVGLDKDSAIVTPQ